MSKRPSLFHEFLTSLRDQERFGQSKHEAKRIAINKAHAQGRSGFGVALEGVFSVVSFKTYRQVAHEFASWCTRNRCARTMDGARPYVAVYLQERIDRGLSAWTIQRDRAALRKIFKDTELADEVEVPRRKLKEIKRSRLLVKMDQQFDEEKYRDLVDFSKAAGLRRHELAMVTPEDVYWQDNRLKVYVFQGKGGKSREVTVVVGMENHILEIIRDCNPGQPIFKNIPSRMDVHSYRSVYAQTRLEQASEIEVSRDLGHNRTDVIRGHYARRGNI